MCTLAEVTQVKVESKGGREGKGRGEKGNESRGGGKEEERNSISATSNVE